MKSNNKEYSSKLITLTSPHSRKSFPNYLFLDSILFHHLHQYTPLLGYMEKAEHIFHAIHQEQDHVQLLHQAAAHLLQLLH